MLTDVMGDKYFICDKIIGEGSSCKVKLGVSKADGEKVAIKIIDKNALESKGFNIEKIRREINILRKLNHPHIIKLLDVYETRTRIALVLEYCPGGDLFEHVFIRGKLKETEARNYFRQIVSAIGYCHRNGICHRDIKLENILFDSENRHIKIIDFGLANFNSDPDHLMNTLCGTRDYAAPELILGSTAYKGNLVDVWSLGVALYIMVVGKMPFYSNNSQEMFLKICTGKVNYPAGISVTLVDLFKNIFVTNPNKRYNIEDIINHLWVNIGYDFPVSTNTLFLYSKKPVFVPKMPSINENSTIDNSKVYRRSASMEPVNNDPPIIKRRSTSEDLTTVVQQTSVQIKKKSMFTKILDRISKNNTPSTNSPRIIKGSFSSCNTSIKTPEELITEIEKILKLLDLTYKREGFIFRNCHSTKDKSVVIELEVCRLYNLGLNGINIKRIKGSTDKYIPLCGKLTNMWLI